MSNPSISVSEFNKTIKLILESDMLLKDCWIYGEISGLKSYAHGKQHYFTLTDGNSQLNCVLYNNTFSELSFSPQNGLAVFVRGKPVVFHKKGRYVFHIHFMTLSGDGLLQYSFEHLKSKLHKEGLFDPENKQEIPRYPSHVGLITAPNSAALHDFIRIKMDTAPHLKLSLIPAVMQGADSPKMIINALQIAHIHALDVIVILRGGGSAEDLSAFNDEDLVRYIAQCATPIVSAIGHDVDHTLTDFVVDYRCPTPTAAAHHICYPFINWKTQTTSRIKLISEQLQARIQITKTTLYNALHQYQQYLTQSLTTQKNHMDHTMKRLAANNPVFLLQKGYGITRHSETREIINSVSELNKQCKLYTSLQDGAFTSIVTEILKKDQSINDTAK